MNNPKSVNGWSGILYCAFFLDVFLWGGGMPNLSWAQRKLPPMDENCINDNAEIVSKNDLSSIRSLCKKASDEKVELMVVTVDSLDEYKPSLSLMFNLERLVGRMFDQWNVGYEEKGNAIMLFVAMREREFRVLVGDNFSDSLRTKAGKIIHNTLAPAFRQRKHSWGIYQAYNRLFREVAVPHIIATKRAQQRALQQLPVE